MSLKVSVPARLRLMRCNSPSSALVASALRSDTCSRSAPTGLTTKSTAPARIAETTLSMPPCAVCTITGMRDAASRMRASTPRPSRSGITRSSTTQSMPRAVRPVSSRDCRVAALGDERARSRTGAPCFRAAGAAPDRRRRSEHVRPWRPWRLVATRPVPNSGPVSPDDALMRLLSLQQRRRLHAGADARRLTKRAALRESRTAI